MALLLAAAVVLSWRGLVTLPHRYADLRAHGVPVRLYVVRCGRGLGGDSHAVGCRVRLDYGGYSATWKEDDVRRQASADGTIGGVVDPVQPEIHATAAELSTRAGAGFRGSSVFAALLATLLAALLGGLELARAAGGRPGQRQE